MNDPTVTIKNNNKKYAQHGEIEICKEKIIAVNFQGIINGIVLNLVI